MILKEGGCEACPLFNGLKRRCGFAASIAENMDENAIRKNIDIVIKWAKDHPVKTRKSEFLKLFPNAEMVNIERTFCVAHFEPTKKCKGVNPSEEQCIACRYRFWNEEVTDND
jgi:hypothetical protein